MKNTSSASERNFWESSGPDPDAPKAIIPGAKHANSSICKCSCKNATIMSESKKHPYLTTNLFYSITLSLIASPVFSQMYVKDDGVLLRTKLCRPFIDVSHISLFPRVQIKCSHKESQERHTYFTDLSFLYKNWKAIPCIKFKST